MKKPGSFIVVFLLSFIGLKSQKLYIDTCYKLATQNYPLIKQYDLIEKSKDYTLNNAGKAYLPQVNFTAIEGYVFGDYPNFGPPGSSSSNFKFIGIGQVNQTIWDGGATKTQKKIITASAASNKASLDDALFDLRSRVNQLYFGILLIDEQLKQLEVQNSILDNNIHRIKQLNENGLTYKTDVDEIEVQKLKLNQQKKEFNYARNGYITMLSFFIGLKLDQQTQFQKPDDNTFNAFYEIKRPELSFYKSQRDLINAQSEMQKVSLMPKIGLLGAGLVLAPGLSSGKATTIGVAGLNVSWNIEGLYKKYNDQQLTIQSLNKVNVQEETFLFNTRLQMTQQTANIEKQKAILEDDDGIVNLSQRIREGYQLKYDTGVGTLHDLLNSIENENAARAQKAIHEMQLLSTEYDYKTITGN